MGNQWETKVNKRLLHTVSGMHQFANVSKEGSQGLNTGLHHRRCITTLGVPVPHGGMLCRNRSYRIVPIKELLYGSSRIY